MDRRILGSTDLQISPVGLGAWAIGGGDWILGWGPQDDRESLITIRRAVELGINWIDTASAYGLGHSETVIARALRDIPRRERPYVFTKCSLVWDELGNVSHDLSPQSIRQQAEASLRRLGVDCIDLYQIGWPVWDKACGCHPRSLEDAWETMAALQREGRARYIGVSACDAKELGALHRIAAVTTLQAPYSLLRREIENVVLPFCERQHIAVIACSTMASGLLSGRMTGDRAARLPHNDWRRRSQAFEQPTLARISSVVDRMRWVGERHGRTPVEVAIGWALRNRAVTAAAVGARHPQQVDEILGATSLRLDAEDARYLDEVSSSASQATAECSPREPVRHAGRT